jgi:hypothetical protein
MATPAIQAIHGDSLRSASMVCWGSFSKPGSFSILEAPLSIQDSNLEPLPYRASHAVPPDPLEGQMSLFDEVEAD